VNSRRSLNSTRTATGGSWAPAPVLVSALALVLFGAACAGEGTGGLHSERGVQSIEDVVGPQIGLGPLTATCEAGDGLGFGDQFTCEALTESGETILFVASITDGGMIDVVSLNLLTDDVIAAIEVAAIDVVQVSQGLQISPNGIQCGEGPVILPAGEILSLTCGVLHPNTGQVHTAVIRLTDLLDLRMTVEISEDPT